MVLLTLPDQICRGFNEAILTMKKGEISLFTLPPDLGFGALGTDGVPPNSIIQFEIELISWSKVVDVCKDGGILKRVVKNGEHTGQPGDLDEVKGSLLNSFFRGSNFLYVLN